MTQPNDERSDAQQHQQHYSTVQQQHPECLKVLQKYIVCVYCVCITRLNAPPDSVIYRIYMLPRSATYSLVQLYCHRHCNAYIAYRRAVRLKSEVLNSTLHIYFKFNILYAAVELL